MRRPRTEARPGDWMTQKGLTNRGPLQKPDLLFEFLIIALDTPTEFSEVHQLAEGDVFRQGRKPIFGRFFLTFGPFDQQPLFGPAFRACVISMRDTNPHASKAR